MQINLLRQQKIVRAELTELDRGLLHTFNNLNHIFYPLAQRGAMLKVIVIIMTVHEHVSEFGRSLPPALAWTEYAWMRIRETGAGDLVWHSPASRPIISSFAVETLAPIPRSCFHLCAEY